MNVRLHLAEIRIPARIRRKKIRELAVLTANGFGIPPPPMAGLSIRRLLGTYARFTRESADRAVADRADPAPIREALRREAFAFGKRLAAEFRTLDRGESLRLLRLVYKAIGIDFRAEPGGPVRIRRCFFSGFYEPETCRTIAALDEGLMAGILGEGSLDFSERITEGHAECRAVFRFRETRP